MGLCNQRIFGTLLSATYKQTRRAALPPGIFYQPLKAPKHILPRRTHSHPPPNRFEAILGAGLGDSKGY